MPLQWTAPPEGQLDNMLERSWASLHQTVESNPPLETVTGVPMEQMMEHARQAAESYIEFFKGHPVGAVEGFMQVYCLGFVVGTQYGELRHTMKE